MGVSKNQRSTYSIPGKSTHMKVDGDARIILPLNQGKHCYVFDPVTRKTVHTATGSDAFFAALANVVEADGQHRVDVELDRMATSYGGPWLGMSAKLATYLEQAAASVAESAQ